MAGLANGAPLQEPITAEPVAMTAFGSTLTPSGLPRLIFVDQGSLLKGLFMQLLQEDDSDDDDVSMKGGSGKSPNVSRHRRPSRPPPQAQECLETSSTREHRPAPVLVDANNPIQQRLPSRQLLAQQGKAALQQLRRSIEGSSDKLLFARRKRGI